VFELTSLQIDDCAIVHNHKYIWVARGWIGCAPYLFTYKIVLIYVVNLAYSPMKSRGMDSPDHTWWRLPAS